MKFAVILLSVTGLLLAFPLNGQDKEARPVDWDGYEIGFQITGGDQYIDGPHLIFKKEKGGEMRVFYEGNRLWRKTPEALNPIQSSELKRLLSKLYKFESKTKASEKKVVEQIKEAELKVEAARKSGVKIPIGIGSSMKMKISIASGGKKNGYWYVMDLNEAFKDCYSFIDEAYAKYKKDEQDVEPNT